MATTTNDIERIDQVIEEAFNGGELGVIDEVIADEYVLHSPTTSREFSGPEGFKENVRRWRSAFPDFRMVVEDRVVGEDRVADRMTMTGTHEGEFMGIEPTGREVEISAIVIHHVEDGRGVADYAVVDALGLLRQLGVVDPATG